MNITENIIKQRLSEFTEQRDKRLAQMDAAAEDQKAGWQRLVSFYNALIAVCQVHLKKFD